MEATGRLQYPKSSPKDLQERQEGGLAGGGGRRRRTATMQVGDDRRWQRHAVTQQGGGVRGVSLRDCRNVTSEVCSFLFLQARA